MSEVRPRRRRQGPVVRGQQTWQPTTTDQRLLDAKGSVEWVHEDPWRVMRIQSEFVEGFGTLAELGPAVTVFGSARTVADSEHYAAGIELGRKLAMAGFAVVTGGGPGAMEAANRGAAEAGGVSVGLGIELPYENTFNDWVNLGIYFRYFFVRKVMFLKYACGVVALPGGVGTMDELFETVTLVQTGKLTSFPIIMYGCDYWQGVRQWMERSMVPAGYVSPDDLALVRATDDLDEIVELMLTAETRISGRVAASRRDL
ncbi:TIGR00730 family Rossman fold protein [Raineyella fluvialis]|uniref:Cytokinin riboside 5'-monophosphate phosphoribohydrolase n=1 Tax=Raineyella fluvialis TaxID=2662261 RepID=A0A5Q2FBN9_9ACTN|nr:TIGR00730 family Rossman fold protein [Raineyella fluvialis]QGF24158.1 TIGR00730 family Rossman fold protein [Raineyella fluvialis]